jgi:hypothetical protein
MHFPSTIIFAMPDRVARIQRLWREHDLCLDDLTLERATDESIEGIVSCLDRFNLASSALMTLSSNVCYMDGYHGRGQGFAQQNATEHYKLGLDFFNLFCEHKLYLDGKFDYVYSGRCSNKEIILIRY